uniref:Serpentine Receptor, class T n=1 Tax=Steinernema glaseri TaxID=37863 RepID=A0A1I8AG56_9BILA
MTLIGVVQLLILPTEIVSGFCHILNEDLWVIIGFPLKLFWMTTRVEYLLSFVLALNRVKIMCQLNISASFLKLLIFLIAIYGILLLVALHTPYCDLIFHIDHFISTYDMSRPYSYLLSQSTAIISMAAMCGSLVCYIIVIGYLVFTRSKNGKIKNWKHERCILIYAFVRFVCDMYIVVAYNYFKFPPISWIGLPISLTFPLNNLIIPVILYLTLNKNVRREFFNAKTTNYVSSGMIQRH